MKFPGCAPFLVLMLFLPAPAWAQGESVVDYLLTQTPPDPQADGANRYSLTDIQTAVGAELYWNVLLRRAVFVDPNSRVTFSLVIDSRLGRVGDQVVEWPAPPTLRRGEIYVSRDLLETVFSRFPDYRAPGQAESLSEIPDEPPGTGDVPEEPPTAASSGPVQIRSVLLLAVAAAAEVDSASGAGEDVAGKLVAAVETQLKEGGVDVRRAAWDSDKAEETYIEADALVALRVESSSPTMRTSFFYYSVGAARADDQSSGLWPWSRVSENHKQDSRSVAELLFRNYVGEFGEARAVGLRGGPLDVLEGRTFPSVLLNVGIDPSLAEEEIGKAAAAISRSLLELKPS